jgi:hypothetical protein
MTSLAIQQQWAERTVARAEKAAITARSQLGHVSAAKDGRMLALLHAAHPDRIRFAEATNRAREAEAALDQARAQLERLREARKPKHDARTVLREAVAAAQKAARATPRHKATVERSRALLSKAQEQLAAAEAGLEKAREVDARNVARAASGARSPSVSAMRKARERVQAAEDAVTAAQTARDALQQKEPEIAHADANSKEAVEAAVTAVLKAEFPIDKLIRDCTETQALLIKQRMLLRQVLSDRLASPETEEAIRGLLREHVPPSSGVDWGDPDWSRHPVVNGWRKMREALARDPGAGLDLEKL